MGIRAQYAEKRPGRPHQLSAAAEESREVLVRGALPGLRMAIYSFEIQSDFKLARLMQRSRCLFYHFDPRSSSCAKPCLPPPYPPH
jgi:hypothetical protein